MSADAPWIVRAVRRRPVAATLWFLVIAALPVVLAMRFRAAPLEDFGEVPAFRLTDQNGRAYGSDELRGRVWVANFMFTSCPSSCPRLTRHMARVQTRLRDARDRVRLVSFSVDPEVDTPARLREYGGRYGVDPAMWSLLTGPNDAVQRISVQGFNLAVDAPSYTGPRPANYNILHGEHIMVIDQRAHIRGYFRADATGLDQVNRAVRRLLRDQH
ncbi:MAG: SCO family protein [Polyangiales bacterium]